MLAPSLHIYPALETRTRLQQHADIDSPQTWNAEGVAAATTGTVSLLLLLLSLLQHLGRLPARVSKDLHGSTDRSNRVMQNLEALSFAANAKTQLFSVAV